LDKKTKTKNKKKQKQHDRIEVNYGGHGAARLRDDGRQAKVRDLPDVRCEASEDVREKRRQEKTRVCVDKN
jgi:hypothetical protein